MTHSQATKVVDAALLITRAVADSIKESTELYGFCPLGPVYAALNARGISMEVYQRIIDTLVRCKFITVTNETAKWILK